MLFSNLREQKLATIRSIQQQIDDLQDALSQEQAHLQAIGSVEQSAESALNQVANAIRGIETICPEQMALFKAQLLELFTDRAPLPPGDDNPDNGDNGHNKPPANPIDMPSPDSPDIPPIDVSDNPIDMPVKPDDALNPIVDIPDTPDTPISPPKKRGRKPKPLAA